MMGKTQRAKSPARAMPGTKWAGATNADMLDVIREAVGGPLVVGSLYRLTFAQGSTGEPVGAIVEYRGMTTDHAGGYAEPALLMAIRNPVLPMGARYGTVEHPLVLWPMDVLHISPAEPGDMDVPMSYRDEDGPPARTPGTPRVQ